MPKGVITLHTEEGVGEPAATGDISPDSIMGVGSIGKMFTQAAVYRLAEDDKINLNKPAVDYFQGNDETHQAIRQLFKDSGAEKATVADLVNHTSGLPYPMMQDYVRDNEADMAKPASVHTVLTEYMNAPDTAKPVEESKKKDYNNINYMILGRLLEDVTGKEDFRDVVVEQVIVPLGLKHTGYAGHSSLENQEIVSPQFNGDAKQTQQALAAGSIFTTATELDTFIREYGKGINGGPVKNTLFNPTTLEMMHENVKNGLGGNYDHANNQVVELGQAGETSCFGANVQHNPTNGKTNVTMVVAEVSGQDIGRHLGPADTEHRTKEGNSIFTPEQQEQLDIQQKNKQALNELPFASLSPEDIKDLNSIKEQHNQLVPEKLPEQGAQSLPRQNKDVAGRG